MSVSKNWKAPAALGLLLLATPAAALEWIPLFKLDLLGGQFFFDGQSTSFSGNADWLLSPGLKLSDKDVLVLAASGQYRRTREVRELIGGGFLTQESLDNAASVKWVHQWSERWTVKPGVSYKNELITESEDESLGKGLFDYHKLGFGVEFERRGDRLKSLRHGLNAYGVRFYHYHSLSTQAQQFGAEIAAGDRVLDFNAYDYSVAADFLAGPGTLLTASLLGSYRPFLDQKVVNLTGGFDGRNRMDLYGSLSSGLQQRLPAWSWGPASVESVAGVNLGWTLLVSNQGDYDAAKTRFNKDYYDYGELEAGPFLALQLNKKLSATLAYGYTRRAYASRPVQDSDGNYGADAIRMGTHTLSYFFSYPLYKRLLLKAQGAHRIARSNMKFEQTYRYNYDATHYFVGFGYSY